MNLTNIGEIIIVVGLTIPIIIGFIYGIKEYNSDDYIPDDFILTSIRKNNIDPFESQDSNLKPKKLICDYCGRSLDKNGSCPGCGRY